MAINFSAINSRSLFGKILRLPLRLLPQGMVIPILQGKLKGYRWVVGAGNHGCWLGTYEFKKQHVFEKYTKTNDIVYDIGANVGYYTLLSSILVGESGQVIAFEPLPLNINHLNNHINANNITNTTVLQVAVADYTGKAFFEDGDNNYQGKLALSGHREVDVVSLDNLLFFGQIPLPSIMKIDVEGAELAVLHGAVDLLSRAQPIIFLATHGKHVHQECCSLLSSMGYRVRALHDGDIDATDELLALPQ